MIDCHNHMLPSIDDGAHDEAMALAMARRAVASGIETVVCTPHHMNGVFTNDRQSILREIESMRGVLENAGIALTLLPGSELHLVPELPSQVLEGEALTFADKGKAVLVELPKRMIPTGTEGVLETLIFNGITPIIAHPERNGTLASDPELAEQWTTWGCKLQLTAMSCSGQFGSRIQDVSRHWVEQGVVHLIASDAHRPSGRAPDMRRGAEAIASWVGEEIADVLVQVNPHNIISGLPIVDVPKTKTDASVKSQKKHRSQSSRKPGLLGRIFGSKR